MLRFFNNYHKSVVGIIIVLGICISMLFFGVGLGDPTPETYAIKVRDHEISFSEFYERKREIETRYQNMFGDKFYQFRDQLLKDINQNLSDQLVDDLLVEQEAREFEMFTGELEVQKIITTQLFPSGYSAEKYRALLAQTGMSSRQFEARLAADALKQQFQSILQDVAAVSEFEAKTMLKREETEYDIEYVELKAADFVSKASDPSPEELSEYYESNATDYEVEAKAKYAYATFQPEKFMDVVEITDEDVELYYTDNEREFSEPEQVKVRHIQLNYPTSSEPEAMTKVKSLAEELHGKIQAGEDISALAELHSDDVTTKLIGGELGWIKKGEKDPAIEKAAFERKSGGLAEIVEVDYGYHLIFVDDFKEQKVKEIDEVKAQIVAELKKREAPAYASAIAGEKYEQWIASGKTLEEFAASENLEIQTTSELFAKNQDPAGFPGVSAQVLENAPSEKQLVEAKTATLLVEVKEFREPHVAELETVKEKVIAAWKQAKSKELVQEAASELVQGIQDGKTLKELADAKEYKIWEKKDQKLGKSAVPPFTDSDVLAAVLGSNVGTEPTRFHKVDDSYLLFKVTAKTPPSNEEVQELIEAYQSRAKQQVAQNLTRSVLNQLRAEAVAANEIDVNAGILTN